MFDILSPLLSFLSSLFLHSPSPSLPPFFSITIPAVGTPEGQVAMIKTVLSALLVDGASASPWEPLHGGLMAGAAAVTKIAGGTGLDDDDTFKLVANTAVAALSHGESRIRIQAGETLGALCKAKGAFVFTEFAMETLIAGIRDNMERDTTEALPKTLAEQMEKKKSKFDKVKVGKTAAEIFHESAGWKSLETSSKALLEVIKGCGASFVPHITQELVTLVFDSLGTSTPLYPRVRACMYACVYM